MLSILLSCFEEQNRIHFQLRQEVWKNNSNLYHRAHSQDNPLKCHLQYQPNLRFTHMIFDKVDLLLFKTNTGKKTMQNEQRKSKNTGKKTMQENEQRKSKKTP